MREEVRVLIRPDWQRLTFTTLTTVSQKRDGSRGGAVIRPSEKYVVVQGPIRRLAHLEFGGRGSVQSGRGSGAWSWRQ